jgi:hypothetical protein
MDAGTPVAAFTARRELQAYLPRRLDTFINPLVYTFWGNKAINHDHDSGAGRCVRSRYQVEGRRGLNLVGPPGVLRHSLRMSRRKLELGRSEGRQSLGALSALQPAGGSQA